MSDPPAPPHIDYYFTTMSPWAYVGHAAFSDLARRHRLVVRHHPVALLAVFSDSGGLPLAKRHLLRKRYRMVELQRWRERRRLAFHLEPRFWPFDASIADRVVVALSRSGRDPDRFLAAAFAACWEDQRNLGDPDELGRLLTDAGLDAKTVLADAQTEAVAAAYATETRGAIKAGVFGSPSYGFRGEIFWGQDRIELLDDALTSGRAPFRA